ncbi:MAG: ribosome small subunit-dependent GTPase A [Betaproteobacteria bacterium]|nr:ribosome small subunit-dependent GTPase A [Betaproteobacteria bacterium]
MPSELFSGLVVAAHGRHYQVMLADGSELRCYSRGKKSDVVCGDRVEGQKQGQDVGVIESILPRRNLFYRSNVARQKLIAANVDLVLLVVAVMPAFSGELIERCRVAARQQNMDCLILLNKCDLADGLPAARKQLYRLAHEGCEIMEISARNAIETTAKLTPMLRGKVSLLAGQSGMGKSTLINALVPNARAATGTVSLALASGKHTTTAARLYFLPPAKETLAAGNEGGALIDSPGLQAFGLAHLAFAELEAAFPEFQPYLGYCRFRDCRHQQEPGCALAQAAEKGAFSPERLLIFRALSESIRFATPATSALRGRRSPIVQS